MQGTPEEFERALRLGLPSTLISRENAAFQKRSSKRTSRFRLDRKHENKNEAFCKR